MNPLVPIHNSIMNYKRQTQDERDPDEVVAEVLEQYGQNKHLYLRFVLFPDIYEPVRPPTLFPYPTHMFRDIGSMNLTATGGALYLAWAPFNRGTASTSSLLTTWNASNAFVANTNIGGAITGEVDTAHNVPSVTGISAMHVRGIGAFIQVSYIGRLDEMSGVIEVGLAIDDGVNGNNSAATRYVTTAALKGLYQYKKYDVSHGVRCVYLPLAPQALEFIGGSQTSLNLNQVYHVHISGVTTSSGVFRVDYGYYYDGIPDESAYNTLLPKKPPKKMLSKEETVNIIHDNIEHIAITPANPAENGHAAKLWNQTKESFWTKAGHFAEKALDKGFEIAGAWVDKEVPGLRAVTGKLDALNFK